jgi:hypothetical protein
MNWQKVTDMRDMQLCVSGVGLGREGAERERERESSAK